MKTMETEKTNEEISLYLTQILIQEIFKTKR